MSDGPSEADSELPVHYCQRTRATLTRQLVLTALKRLERQIGVRE